jgi:hypothetical protein
MFQSTQIKLFSVLRTPLGAEMLDSLAKSRDAPVQLQADWGTSACVGKVS